MINAELPRRMALSQLSVIEIFVGLLPADVY